MDCKKVGNLIYTLRKEKQMTQKSIAEKMNISDKTISKWERGLGCPDVSLLAELSQILGVNIEELLIGDIRKNNKVGGDMKKIQFYVCPSCGNMINSTGEAIISCCGRKVEAGVAQKAENKHRLNIEIIEDEYFLTMAHSMTKEEYISFISFVTGDKVFTVKQYPEWAVQLRLPKLGHGILYFYCTKHGLFYQMI